MYKTVRIALLDWQVGSDTIIYHDVSCYGEDEATFFFNYLGRTVTFNKHAVLGWSVG